MGHGSIVNVAIKDKTSNIDPSLVATFRNANRKKQNWGFAKNGHLLSLPSKTNTLKVFEEKAISCTKKGRTQVPRKVKKSDRNNKTLQDSKTFGNTVIGKHFVL